MGGKFFPIHKQRHTGEIRVDLDFCLRFHPIFVPSAAQMDERFPAEIRFINVESVLFDGAVKGNEALLVLPRVAALVPAVRGEVEAIPAVHTPNVRPLRPKLQHMLVIKGLVALRPVPLLRAGALIGRIGVRAILGQAYWPIGMLCVEFIKELVVLLHLPQIPPIIEVVAGHIRKGHQRVVRVEHKSVGHSRGTGGIQLVAQVIELPVCLHQFLGDAPCHRDLVGQAPAENGRVVIALGHQLLHLG